MAVEPRDGRWNDAAMPGYIRGFVEREFADGWEFVTRVDPFTGAQSDFKYLVFGMKQFEYLEPPPHTEGFPADLGPATKLAIFGRHGDPMQRLSNQDLEERFETTREDMRRERYSTLADLRAFDWDSAISYENWERLRADAAETDRTIRLSQLLGPFELVDEDGTDYADWASTDGGTQWRWKAAEEGLAAALLDWELVSFEGRTARIRKRTRREILPDHWFRLLVTLDEASHWRQVRFVFFWEH